LFHVVSVVNVVVVIAGHRSNAAVGIACTKMMMGWTKFAV